MGLQPGLAGVASLLKEIAAITPLDDATWRSGLHQAARDMVWLTGTLRLMFSGGFTPGE